MGLDQEVCGACRRPRDEQEIQNGRESIRESARRRRRLPFTVVWIILALAAAAFAIRHREFVIAEASELGEKYREGMKALDDSPPQAKAPPAAAAPPAPAAPSAPSQPRSPEAAPAGAPDPSGVGDLPPPPMNPASQWAFCGRVYDLITLAPVAGAQLNFNAVGNNFGPKVQTDDYGRFCMLLARLNDGSYEIRGSHPKYAPVVLYEPDIPYATLPLEKRREIVRDAQDGDIAPPPLNDVPDESVLRRDVFMAPKPQ